MHVSNPFHREKVKANNSSFFQDVRLVDMCRTNKHRLSLSTLISLQLTSIEINKRHSVNLNSLLMHQDKHRIFKIVAVNLKND